MENNIINEMETGVIWGVIQGSQYTNDTYVGP